MAGSKKHIKINLIKSRKRRIRKERVLFAKIQTISVVVLVGYAVALFAVMGLRRMAESNLSELEARIEREELAITRLAPVEAKAILVRSKLDLLKGYYQDNLASRRAMIDLYTQMPEGVEMSSVSFGETEGEIEITGEASSVFAVEGFLPQLQQWWDERRYAQILLSGFSRNSSGSYSFSGTFALGDRAPSLLEVLRGGNADEQ